MSRSLTIPMPSLIWYENYEESTEPCIKCLSEKPHDITKLKKPWCIISSMGSDHL